jgi:aldose 1-epimerase
VITLTAGDARLVVDETGGGRVVHLEAGGLALVVSPEVDEHDHGIFPMAPWAGRVRHGDFTFDGEAYHLPTNKPPHAIHGTVRDTAWTVEDVAVASAVLSVGLADPWPFGGRVVQRFALEPDGLAVTMEVHATERAMPVSCGWHPWWSRSLDRGEPLEVELHAAAMYRVDGEGIPSGEVVPVVPPPWDDCFTDLGEPAAILRWPGAGTLTITTDCPCVVVYTDPEHAVCVEPQSGPPDEFNLAPRVVEPGSPLIVHATFRWALDD